jgi:hypothetical protein
MEVAYFRAHNAALVVNAATWILWDLAHGGTPKDSKSADDMAGLREGVAELFPCGHPTAAVAVPPP